MATTTAAVGVMKSAQISKPGADFQIVEREIPKPGVGQVRIKVQGLWDLPQRRAHERRRLARHSVSPRSGT